MTTVKELEKRYLDRAKKLVQIHRETNRDIQETNRDKPPHPSSYYLKRENTRMRELHKLNIEVQRDKKKLKAIS